MKTCKEILISLEVAKKLENDRQSFEETEDDILRRKYGLPPANRPESRSNGQGRPVVCRGGTIPHGTKLRSTYLGRPWSAKVENGRIYLEGGTQEYRSPSAAAWSITRGGVNGWNFWEYEIESGKWDVLSEIRKQKREASGLLV